MPALGPPYMPRNCASLSCVRGNRNSVASAERHTPTTSPECARSPGLRHAVTHGPGKVSTATAQRCPIGWSIVLASGVPASSPSRRSAVAARGLTPSRPTKIGSGSDAG
jgi:hypothetical protein